MRQEIVQFKIFHRKRLGMTFFDEKITAKIKNKKLFEQVNDQNRKQILGKFYNNKIKLDQKSEQNREYNENFE